MRKVSAKIFSLICITFISIQAQDNFELVLDGLHFPEGPAWDGSGNLYVSSCYGGYITKISGEESSIFVDSSKTSNLKQTNGLTVYKDGNIYACDYGIGAIIKINPDGEPAIFVDGYKGNRFNRPNDLAFDNNGNLYFTDPKSYGKDKLDGRVFKISLETKKVTLLADSLAFPNGIAFSLDGLKLFICESAKNRILVFDVDEKGLISNKKVFAELPGGDPDGLALDSQGNLYTAHFGGGAIYIFSPDGNIQNKILTPGSDPSNVEFGSEDMKTLFITEDKTNSVYSLRVEIPGTKLFSSPDKN